MIGTDESAVDGKIMNLRSRLLVDCVAKCQIKSVCVTQCMHQSMAVYSSLRNMKTGELQLDNSIACHPFSLLTR
jgi:hypothetical protein